MKSKEEKPVLFKDRENKVWRDANCECGKRVYKKCLTDNSIEILVDHRKTVQKIIPQGDITVTKISCWSCGKVHIVGGIKENIEVSDEVSVKQENL